SSVGYAMSYLAPGDVAPGCTLPRIGLARQSEHALTDDVLVHFGRAPLDRVGAAAQHAADLVRRLALPRPGARAEQRRRPKLDPLVERSLMHLAYRALGPGRAPGLGRGAHALVRPVADRLFAVDAHQLLTHHRVGERASLARHRQQVVDATP